MKLLMSNGADIHSKTNNDGWTALMRASMKGRVNAMELMISKRSDINVKNNDDCTPLTYASTIKAKELLISKGAKP
jgi:ankyrin repeat protein